MTEVFVIHNQQGHFWGKSKSWVDGSDARAVMRLKHRDEAANTLFELSSKDFELRGDILAAQVNAKGLPVVQVSDIPLPEPPQEELPLADAADSDGTETAAAEPGSAQTGG
jgi:hypothetical protein